jgi:hypothetical protein
MTDSSYAFVIVADAICQKSVFQPVEPGFCAKESGIIGYEKFFDKENLENTGGSAHERVEITPHQKGTGR